MTAEAPAREQAPGVAGRASRRLRRRYSLLTRRDKIVLGRRWSAIPTLIQLVLVWIPTVLSVLLSFVRWNGLAFSDIRPAGLANYEFIFTTTRRSGPPCSTTCSGWCSSRSIATPLGLLLAVLLDQNIRGIADLPEHLLRAGHALAGADRHHLAAVLLAGQRSPELPARHVGHAAGRRLVRRPARQHLGRARRRHLAARRLRHDPVPGGAEGRRPVPARGRLARRRQRACRPSSGSSSR